MPANRWLVPIWIVAGVLVVGLLIAGLGRGDSSPNDGDRGQSTGEAIACASYLVDGTVIEASQSAPDRVSLTMTVSEWLKPQAGPPTLKVTVTDSDLSAYGLEPWAPGTSGLLLVPSARRYSAALITGELHDAQLVSYRRHLDDAQGLACPKEFQ